MAGEAARGDETSVELMPVALAKSAASPLKALCVPVLCLSVGAVPLILSEFCVFQEAGYCNIVFVAFCVLFCIQKEKALADSRHTPSRPRLLQHLWSSW